MALARRGDLRPQVPGGRLVGWLALVGTLIALAYLGNAAASPEQDVLYQYSTAVAALVQYALMAGVLAFIARGVPREVLGFRRPTSWGRSLGLVALALGAIWALSAALTPFLDADGEQGLLPDSWDSTRAPQYAANFLVIAVVAPVVEETAYRGVGFGLVDVRFGPIAAVLVTGVAFGLSHGLLVALPVLTAFGLILGALRARTESVYPPMVLHGAFNAAALVAAVMV